MPENYLWAISKHIDEQNECHETRKRVTQPKNAKISKLYFWYWLLNLTLLQNYAGDQVGPFPKKSHIYKNTFDQNCTTLLQSESKWHEKNSVTPMPQDFPREHNQNGLLTPSTFEQSKKEKVVPH